VLRPFDGVAPKFTSVTAQGRNRLRNRPPVYGTTCRSLRLGSNSWNNGERHGIGVETELMKSLGMMQATA
jgi:hypothetical protein